jgi:nonsense-mediated mRNA decay protein 3
VNLLDPTTLQTTDVSTPIYWRTPFTSLADVQDLVEFIILEIEPLGPAKGRFLLAEATVARASDLGVNDKTYFTRTHLGQILHTGDSVLGYQFTGTNFNNPQFEAVEQSSYADSIPDVMLVKKFYSRKKKSKSRQWRLKRMARDEGELVPKKQDQERMERDFEMFLRDVEEDTELRTMLSLYKTKNQNRPSRTEKMEGIEGEGGPATTVEAASTVEEDSEDNEDFPKINMDELLDEFDELNMEDAP